MNDPLWGVFRWHRMTRANLNKNEKFLTNAIPASKYIPKRPRIWINWNPPFHTRIYLVNVPLNVNTVKPDLLNKKQFLKILWNEVWKGGFQLIQILGLLDMYFDAVVVFVKENSLLFKLTMAIVLWEICIMYYTFLLLVSSNSQNWSRSGIHNSLIDTF